MLAEVLEVDDQAACSSNAQRMLKHRAPDQHANRWNKVMDERAKYHNASALVLAAGLSTRFISGNKLLQDLAGQPVAAHVARTLMALPFRQHIAVCTAGPIAAIYEAIGFKVIINRTPEAGMGTSLQVGIDALGGNGPVLICLADMPFVSSVHVSALFHSLPLSPTRIVATSAPGYRGPPAVLSSDVLNGKVFGGDFGARELLKDALMVPTECGVIIDIDDEAALAKARQSIASSNN